MVVIVSPKCQIKVVHSTPAVSLCLISRLDGARFKRSAKIKSSKKQISQRCRIRHRIRISTGTGMQIAAVLNHIRSKPLAQPEIAIR